MKSIEKLKTKKPKAYKWCRQMVEELYECGLSDFNSLNDDILTLYNFIQYRQDNWDDYVRTKIKFIIKWSKGRALLQNIDTVQRFCKTKYFELCLSEAKKKMPWAIPHVLLSNSKEFVDVPKGSLINPQYHKNVLKSPEGDEG